MLKPSRRRVDRMRLETNRPLHSAWNPVVGFLRVNAEEEVKSYEPPTPQQNPSR